MKPAVTVLIDTYNHERFIEEAIVSVVEQDFPASDMEILVVDDGSTDRTPEIVRKFAPRVRYLPKENGGQASAFNFGIPQARGEIIAFLDGDDWWAGRKLSTVVGVFAESPDVGAIGHGYYAVDEAGAMLRTVVPERKFRLCLRSPGEANLFSDLRCFLGTSKVAYRRSILERVLPIPEVLRFEADEYIWTIAVALADALVLDSPLFFYRFHANNHYMQDSFDKVLLQRRLDITQGLLDHLPPGLKSLGIPNETVAIIMEQNQIDAKRLRLMLEGGMPWETYSVEQTDLRRAYKSIAPRYWAYKQLSLLLALILPPRRFYQLRDWYASNNLHRIRRILADPQPSAPVIERVAQSQMENGRH
jgi:glycosyltransferase involved in cell wall biosynthesis